MSKTEKLFPTIAACFLVAFFLCSLISPALAAERSPREKDPLRVSIPGTVGDGTAFPCVFTGEGLLSVQVSFLGRSITAAAHSGPGTKEIVVLLPVPLDQKSTASQLTWKARLTSGERQNSVKIAIKQKHYPQQNLTVAPKYVAPPKELEERIARERKLLSAAQTTRSPERRWTLPMSRPVPGKITSLYGLRRVFNKQPRAPHRGLDFRAAEGTPIGSIADGTVVLTGDFYYSGKAVVVDHGLGVTSIYMHMSAIHAKEGQQVKAGDILGLVGMTGRSTGPHLHLGLTVLGQSIDPFPLLHMTAEDKAIYDKAFNGAATPSKTSGANQKSPKKPQSAAKKSIGKAQ